MFASFETVFNLNQTTIKHLQLLGDNVSVLHRVFPQIAPIYKQRFTIALLNFKNHLANRLSFDFRGGRRRLPNTGRSACGDNDEEDRH
jgi:hypothetical protein